MTNITVVPIEYVGKKPYKTDNINHTRTVWKKPGEVQMYPEHLAPALLAHEDVWRRGGAKPEVVDAEEPKELTARQAATAREPDRSPSLRDEAKAGPDPARKPGSRALE